MVSTEVMTVLAFGGLVALGAIMVLTLTIFNKNRTSSPSSLRVPRFQYQPRDLPIKPHNIFEEHELNMIRTETLTDEELCRLLKLTTSRNSNIKFVRSSEGSSSDSCNFSSDESDQRPVNCSKSNNRRNAVLSTMDNNTSPGSCEHAQLNSYFTPECSVCVCEFKVGDVVRIMECGHYFHKDCIDGWLTKHSSLCPICKTDTREALGLVPHTILYPDARQRTESDFNGSRQGSGELNEGVANGLTAPLPAVINTHSRAIRVELNV